MKQSIKKRAFTLIEIVLVIVVLGIVAMIGTDIIAHMYEGYIKSKVVNKLQTRTDQVLDLIAKRLSYRIKDSAVTSINGTNYLKLSDSGITINHNILEWIGYDNEGMIGEWDTTKNRWSGWSGFIDLDNSLNSRTQVVSSGSRFDLVKSSIDALSNGSVNFSLNNGGVGLISKCNYDMELTSYGFNGGSGSNIVGVGIGGANKLSVNNANPIDYCEQYYLAWSAYAIVPESSGSDFDLTLRYDYRPWNGQKYSDPTTKKQLLAEHVSTFRFIQTGHTIRIKLCLRDPQTNYGFCKEKAVF
jgi:prepilin-type N-terminal cleavage/methylation domain-containing protein